MIQSTFPVLSFSEDDPCWNFSDNLPWETRIFTGVITPNFIQNSKWWLRTIERSLFYVMYCEIISQKANTYLATRAATSKNGVKRKTHVYHALLRHWYLCRCDVLHSSVQNGEKKDLLLEKNRINNCNISKVFSHTIWRCARSMYLFYWSIKLGHLFLDVSTNCWTVVKIVQNVYDG